MPELPEVESARMLVHTRCMGQKIVGVNAKESGGGPRSGLFDEIVCKFATAEALEKALVGKTLQDTGRRGKLQYWQLSGGSILSYHLGMTGSFTIQGVAGQVYKNKSANVAPADWPPRFCKVEVVFANGARMAFTDPRRLGRVALHASVAAATEGLGPDAFLALPPLPAFGALLQRSVPIGALLLDQSVIAGVGNYLKDEVLYASGIHPETVSSAILAHPAALAALHSAITSVISTAVACDANYSKFPPSWLFHVRWGKGKDGKKMPDGSAITWITCGGRTSAVVVSKQKKLAGKPASASASSTSSSGAGAGASSSAGAGGSSSGGAGSGGAGAGTAAKGKKRPAASPAPEASPPPTTSAAKGRKRPAAGPAAAACPPPPPPTASSSKRRRKE